MDLKVSVITPCLNSGQTIQHTIESVLNQTYKEIEYIIVDGMSADNTMDIVKKYKVLFEGRLKYISEKDEGIYYAMNKGISAASGDIIGIINSDDWYEPDAVEKVVQCFLETNADVVYGEIWIVDGDGKREHHTWHSAFPLHPSTFVRRGIYQKYGKFDTNYRIAADRDFLLRLMTENVRFEYINQMLADFRITGISNTRALECAKESHEINLKYVGKCQGNFLNRDDIEESYDRVKLLHISHVKPQIIKDVLCSCCELQDGVIIFGVGNCGTEFAAVLKNCNISVRFYVDNDEKKWNLESQGIEIHSPEILRHCKGHVVVTVSKYEKDICRQIQDYANPHLSWNTLSEIRARAIEDSIGLFSE